MEVQYKSINFRNIPKSVTEQQLRELFGRKGIIIGFRLRQGFKGGPSATNYGEVDYADALTAKAAAEELNGYQFGDTRMQVSHGVRNRKRKDFDRNNDRQEDVAYLEFGNVPPGSGGAGGAQLDYVQSALKRVPVNIAYEAIEQLRELTLSQPALAEDLLKSNPQLAAATVLILQHAGKVSNNLPAEAFEDNVALKAPLATGSSTAAAGSGDGGGGGGGGSSAADAAASAHNDAQVEKMLGELDDAALEQIMGLADADLLQMEEADRAQIQMLRAYLQRAASA